MKPVLDISRFTGVLLLGLALLAAPSLQMILPQPMVTASSSTCGCGCGCADRPAADDCGTEAEDSGCGCAMEAPKPVPESPLVASVSTHLSTDLAAIEVDREVGPRTSPRPDKRESSLGVGARHGPPLFLLNTSFLI